jgi:hypothetical protein
MESEKFRQTRKPLLPENAEPEQPAAPKILPNMPAQLQAMLNKVAQQQQPMQQEAMPSGPRLGFTGNAKLDELLAGIKEQVYKYEEIQLPSKGKFYESSSSLPSDGILHVRSMTGEEEQILSTQRYVKKGQAIDMIFKNCVREPISPAGLLSIDRTWLLIYLRGISYTPDYEVEIKCSECGKKFETVIDLDHDITVTNCPDDFSQDNLTDKLPKSGYKFTYRLPTGRDESSVTDHREQKISRQMDGGHDDTWMYRAALLISDIEGLTEKVAIQSLIPRLPIQDVAYIRTTLTNPPFGVDTKVDIMCPYCSEGFKVEMPMDTNFFFPAVKKPIQV